MTFSKVSGVEYEAKACIPVFWLSLFGNGNVKTVTGDHEGFEDDERPYAYLACPKEEALARLRSRAVRTERALGPNRAFAERLDPAH